MKLLRATSLLVSAFALAACGSIHPGAAAVVGDEDIPMSLLNTRAEGYCSYLSLQQQTAGGELAAINNAEIRQVAATDLVMGEIASDLVEKGQLEVDPKLGELPDEQEQQLRDIFGEDSDDLIETVTAAFELSAQLVAIGSDVTGQVPNEAILGQLEQAGRQIVMDQYPAYDVEFAPRLGLSDEGEPTAEAGSISVAPIDFEQAQSPDLTGPLGCTG